MAQKATWMEVKLMEMVRELEDRHAELLEHIENLEYFARMVVDGQLSETEHERGIYRRGFRQLLDRKKEINQ